ncbi:hypothetical protein [Jiulongibacter sp. NS-SX5]|uniref:hypothetical protein n=1 Tax=Jiulongibacter sp. NS-SX5 TaxID=3463854 RepID=UPI004058AD98
MAKMKLNSFLLIKLLLVIGFMTAGMLSAIAQRDVLITQADEEIRCRILTETPTRFVYAYVGPKGKILRNEIFKNLVKDFKYNMYDSDLAVIENQKKGKKNKKKKKEDEVPVIASNDDEVKSTAVEKLEINEISSLESESDLQIESEPVVLQQAQKEVVRKEEIQNVESPVKESQKKKPELEKPVEPKVLTQEASDEKVVSEPQMVADSAVDKQVKEVAESKEVVKEEIIEEPIKAKEPVKQKTYNEPEKLVKTQPSDSEVSSKKNVEEEVEVKVAEPVVLNKEVGNELVKEEKTSTPVPVSSEFKNYLKWRVGVKGGIGNIRDKNFVANNSFGLYQEKLLKGWTFGADLAFFPMEGFGIGAVYTDFKSSNSSDNLTYINPMTEVEATGAISNSISRKFIGPALFLRKSIDFKTFVVLSGGPGMYLYSDKGDYDGAQFDYRGQQWGAGATIGLDFLLGNDIIGRDIILSLEAGYNYGRINELDFGDGSGPVILNSPIVMDRLDFSIGLRFMRFPRYLKNSAY